MSLTELDDTNFKAFEKEFDILWTKYFLHSEPNPRETTVLTAWTLGNYDYDGHILVTIEPIAAQMRKKPLEKE